MEEDHSIIESKIYSLQHWFILLLTIIVILTITFVVLIYSKNLKVY